MDATERSISPEIIYNAIANAIIAFSVKLNVASDRFQAFRKYGDAKELAINIVIATNINKLSQLFNLCSSGDCNLSGILNLLSWVMSLVLHALILCAL